MAYDYGNVLEAMAKGVNFDPFGNLAEGWGKGQQSAALRQKMDEATRVRNALQRAAQLAGDKNYPGAAGALMESGDAPSGVKLLTDSDPTLQSNREHFGVTPIMLEGPHGEQIPYQLSDRGRGQAPELPPGTRLSTKWQYLQDPYGNYYPRPKQGSANQPGLDAAPPGTPYAPPGEPQRVQAGATAIGKTEGDTYAEAKRDQAQAKTRLDYTVAAVDDLLKQPGLTRQTGFKGRFLGWLNPQERLNFEAQAQKVNGQTMLAMLDTLKVLKPVSDTDARATTQAAIQLDAWQDPATYAKGARYYQKFLRDNYDILAKRAATPPAPAQQTGAAPAPPGNVADPDEGKTIVNKATGQRMIRQNGQWIDAQ